MAPEERAAPASGTGPGPGAAAGRVAMRGHASWTVRLAALAALLALSCGLVGCAPLAREAIIAYLAVTSRGRNVEIQIDRPFLERLKNRVTMSASFVVDKAMAAPAPAVLDGDLHFAGRSPQVRLPVVGEIANAASRPDAVALVRRAVGTERYLRLSGVWRIWPEHAGGVPEKQGMPVPVYETNNPAHVFEVHPVLWLNGLDLRATCVPVKGFKPGDARRTFEIYQKASCTLRVEPGKVSITTPTGLYNDVEFLMKLSDERPRVVHGGRFVTASALDLDGNVLVKRLRTVFAKGTPPERAVRRCRPGDTLHVYGMPRLDLAEVSRRVRRSATDPAALTGPLPYEIIVLGVFPEGK